MDGSGRVGGDRTPTEPHLIRAGEDDVKVKEKNNVSKASVPSGAGAFLLTKSSGKQLDGLQRRARRKAIAKPLADALVRVSMNGRMTAAYKRTRDDCAERIFQTNGKLHTKFCGSRWCITCSMQRLARVWVGYGDELLSWKNPYLVTLTIPNVPAIELRASVKKMHHKFRTCWKHLRYENNLAVQMVRATEITYSKKNDTYHPHMHLIVNGRQVAVRMVKEWLKRWPDATNAAQDIRKADRKMMFEVAKYAVKMATDTKDENGLRDVVPPVKLNTIFTAIRDLRMWAAVGLESQLDREIKDDGAMEMTETTTARKRVSEEILWEWCQMQRDWIDLSTGDTCSDYIPTPRAEEWVRKMEKLT